MGVVVNVVDNQDMAEYLKRNRTSGGCPVDHEAIAAARKKEAESVDAAKKGALGSGGGCPVVHDGLDPTNMMPATPKQLPHPEQDFNLPTDRVVSSIPRGSPNAPTANWVYPSPQMFYNAVRRKGGDADEESMQKVVSIHNRVNEYCWNKIREWEALRGNPDPKLVAFRGRFKDLSPKARFFMLLGHERPFDRHDWEVERNGQNVRYVIDYYETGEENKVLGDGLDIELDVRPALDSFSAAVDRTRMFFKS